MYRRDDVCPAYLSDTLEASSLERYRYIAGHFSLRPLSSLRALPAIVTLVRDPYAQLRSAYEHGLRWPSDLGPRHLWIGRTFVEWLRDPETEFMIGNLQAQFLAGAVRTASRLSEDELYERAVATLDRCLWYSTTEQLGSSLPRLAAAVGWPAPSELLRLNVAPEPAPPPTAEELELVEARCPVDLRIYRYAVSRPCSSDRAARPRPFERALHRAHTTLVRPLVVELDKPFWGSGWWPLGRQLDETSIRWTTAGATASIDLPVRLRRGDRIDVFVAAAVDARAVTEMQVETNGNRADVRGIHPCPPHFVVPAVVAGDTGGWTRVSIHSPAGDDRERTVASTDDTRAVGIERMVLVPGGARS